MTGAVTARENPWYAVVEIHDGSLVYSGTDAAAAGAIGNDGCMPAVCGVGRTPQAAYRVAKSMARLTRRLDQLELLDLIRAGEKL